MHEPSAAVSATPIPPSSAPMPAASAGDDSVVEKDPADVAAWTDPQIVSLLRSDCGFDPVKMTDAQKVALFGNEYGQSQLTCAGNGFDQSCAYDPCFTGASQDCKEDCVKTCNACDGSCTAACFACKANCQDDECRNACAPTCAQCKQNCLTSQDQCRTGKCSAVYAACRKKLSSDWKAQNCSAACARYTPCRNACYDKGDRDGTHAFDTKACTDACEKAVKTSCDLALCSGKYSMAIEMN